MPFLQNVTINHITKYASHKPEYLYPQPQLRKIIRSVKPSAKRDSQAQDRIPLSASVRRVSRCTSSLEEGSMALEASIAVPLFLFCMINILSMFLMFHVFITNLETLHQQVRQMTAYAYAADEMLEDAGGLIRLYKVQRVKPVVSLPAYSGTDIVSSCYMYAWVGYDVEHKAMSGTEEESMVYVAENGSVYHISRNCTHLSLSVSVAAADQVEHLRNENGGKYYPCEKCGGRGERLYITQEGDRYHNLLQCSGLKRTVRCIPLSEAAGLAPCSRCG